MKKAKTKKKIKTKAMKLKDLNKKTKKKINNNQTP